MNNLEREALLDHLRKQGIDTDRMAVEYLTRWSYNAASYDRLGDILTQRGLQFAAPQPELF